MGIWDLPGQGWRQIGELGLAFVLSALIGLEREMRQKSAGLRTYTLVGFGAALIMLISKYGFMNILAEHRIVLDPSRVAAQIVTGIGFIGGGLIFVRRDSVRGLTTAAVVWLTAAIGMACGAGLVILATVVAAGHFVIILGFPSIARRLPKSRWAPSALQVSYEDGRGILRDVLVTCTQHNFSVSRVQVDRSSGIAGPNGARTVPSGERTVPSGERTGPSGEFTGPSGEFTGSGAGMEAGVAAADASALPGTAANPVQQPVRIVTVNMEVQGIGSVSNLATVLADIPGVTAVNAGDANLSSD